MTLGEISEHYRKAGRESAINDFSTYGLDFCYDVIDSFRYTADDLADGGVDFAWGYKEQIVILSHKEKQ